MANEPTQPLIDYRGQALLPMDETYFLLAYRGGGIYESTSTLAPSLWNALIHDVHTASIVII